MNAYNYKCIKCNKAFTTKQSLKYHIDKSVCDIKYKCISCSKKFKTYELLQEHNAIHLNNNLGENTNESSNASISSKYSCIYCGNIYTRKYTLDKHKVKCTVKKQKEIEVENQIQDYKNMLLMLKEQIEIQNKQLTLQNNKLEQIEKDTLTIKNTHSHSKKIKNIQSNNTINFNINAYGKEDLSHLGIKDYLRCFNKGINCVLEYVKIKHFDPDHPENHNLYIPNLQQPYYKCYDGTKFIIHSIDKLINDIIDTNLIELDGKYEELKETLFNKAIEKYGVFIKKYDSYQRDSILEYLLKEMKLLMYNEKDKPLSSNKKLLR